ncbi:DNA circularization protein [Salinicola avicenniae]|uniref:DNA circularization protein n=1 Tax=Salinicola avicenniae TaxID=2916836 RepID=UPI002073E5FE|nr:MULTISPECIES: DNA circularization N-terminal domain-containing protein [unclassified Salinicola]
MAWRDQYRPATFRGVGFFVRDAATNGGRRTVQHEYPDRDTPYVEDMGRKARGYTIDAFVIGRDYMSARDELLDALEATGAGELVHPYLGALSVNIDTFSARESSDEGGMARFSITFLESGEDRHPNGRRDRLSLIDAQSQAFNESALAAFVDKFSVGGLPAFVSAAASGQLGDLAGVIDSLTGGLFGRGERAARFARDLLSLADEADDLVHRPSDLGERLVAVVDAVASEGRASPRRGTQVLQTLAGWGNNAAPVQRTTSTRARQADNQLALVDLVQQVATSRATTTAARTEWPTYDEAITTRDELADRLDVVMESTDSDNVYLEAQALRTELIEAVPSADQSLPRLSRYTPAATQPALVLAYQLHGDASRADELATRNHVRHPGFVPGGNSLEVLDRG